MLSRYVTSPLSRLLVVALAAMLATLSVVGIAAAAAVSYQQRESSVARAPEVVGEGGAFRFAVEHLVVDDRPAQLMYVVPATSDAPRPPGLSAWPEPGGVVLSPALAAAWTRTDLRVEGIISPSGLADADERIGYVVPPQGAIPTEFWAPATGYGSEDLSARIGVTLYNPPLAHVGAVLLLTVLLPAFLLLASAVRFALRPNARTAALLEQLGAPPSSIQAAQVWVLAPALGLGVTTALVATVPFFLVDVRLGYVDFTFLTEQLRAEVLLLAGSALLGMLLTGALTWWLCAPPPPARYVRGPRTTRRVNVRRGSLTTVSVIASVFSIGMASQVIRFAPQEFALWFGVAVASTLVAGPLLCRYFAGWIAQGLRWVGNRWAMPSATIAGRQMDADSGSWQYASVVSVLLLVVSQVFVAHLVGLAQAKEARDVRAEVGDQISTVAVPSDRALEDVLAAVGPDDFAGVPVVLAYVELDPETGAADGHVVGQTASLEAFGISEAGDLGLGTLPGPTASVLRSVSPGQTVIVEEGDPLAPVTPTEGVRVGATLLLAVGQDAPELDAIRASLTAATAPSWRVELPGEGFVAGAEEILRQGAWLALLGVLAAAMLSLAVLLRQTAVMDRSLARVAPLAGLTGRLDLGGRVVAVQILTMMGIGCMVGGVLSLALGSILTSQGAGAGPPFVPVLGITSTCFLFAGVAICGYWASARRRAADWTPTAETRRG